MPQPQAFADISLPKLINVCQFRHPIMANEEWEFSYSKEAAGANV